MTYAFQHSLLFAFTLCKKQGNVQNHVLGIPLHPAAHQFQTALCQSRSVYSSMRHLCELAAFVAMQPHSIIPGHADGCLEMQVFAMHGMRLVALHGVMCELCLADHGQ